MTIQSRSAMRLLGLDHDLASNLVKMERAEQIYPTPSSCLSPIVVESQHALS